MKIPLFASAALFVIACALPALEFKMSNGTTDVMLGLRAFVIGWSGIFVGIVAWYANSLWAAALLLGFARKPLWAVPLAVAAVLLALTTFKVVGHELPADEGNVNKMTVVRVLPGAYVWMAGLALLPLALCFVRRTAAAS